MGLLDGATERQPQALPDSITPEQQAQLHAIVAAKVGMQPKAIQRKAYAEAWTRFCRHFRIAKHTFLNRKGAGQCAQPLVFPWYPERDLNPHSQRPGDFKSPVSTDSTIRA